MARLERVLGCSACPRSLAQNPRSGLLAYPAGSALVLLNPLSRAQLQLQCPGQCQLTSLACSPCGRFIASGEFGTEPKVRVWELEEGMAAEDDGQGGGQGAGWGAQIAELGWHRLGICCLSFARGSDLLVSVGNQHDKSVAVWDWRANRKLAESRLTSQVNALAVADSGQMFVTVGVRHVKFWYLERENNGTEGDQEESLLLQGRSAILADQRNNTFVDVCCCSPGGQRTFAITVSRLLVEFVDKRMVAIFEMGGQVPLALALGPGLLFLGFNDGAVRAFSLDRDLDTEMELARPHQLREEEPGLGEQNQPKIHPDVHCLAFHAPSGLLTALCSDRSLVHWILHLDGSKPSSSRLGSQLWHVGPVLALECFASLPSGSLLSAGADETVRLWALDGPSSPPELRRVFHLSQGTDLLSERPEKNFGAIQTDSLDSTVGIRCLRLSPGGENLACGLRNGNICVLDLLAPASSPPPKLASFEAHDGEVLLLEFTGVGHQPRLLASAGRDQLVHLFLADQGRDCSHLLSIKEPDGPASFLKFVKRASVDSTELVTFSGSHSLTLRQLISGQPSSTATGLSLRLGRVLSLNLANCCPRALAMTGRGTILVGDGAKLRELELEGEDGLAARKTANILLELDVGNGKAEPDQQISKICLSPCDSLAALLCSDRVVHLVALRSGQSAAVLNLPSDSVTALCFSADCSRLLLASYSGCIFIWRISGQEAGHQQGQQLVSGSEQDALLLSPEAEDSMAAAHLRQQFFGDCLALTSSTTTTLAQHQQQEADDEMDSGIGCGSTKNEGNGGENSSSSRERARTPFRLTRLVLPAQSTLIRRSASNIQQQFGAEGGGAQQQQKEEEQRQQGMVQEGRPMLHPPPLSQAQSSSLRPHHPPPYHQAVLAVQQQQQAGSRSMSNIHFCGGQQQIGAGRRRWNVNSANGANGQPQQQQQQNIRPIAHQNVPAVLSHQLNPSLPAARLLHPPQQFQPFPLAPSPRRQFGVGGMSNSRSLNAIRGCFAAVQNIGDQQQPEAPVIVSPAALPNAPSANGRNSLSRRFLQQGREEYGQRESPATETVWSPAGAKLLSASGGGKGRQTSSLFNPPAGGNSLFIKASRPHSASSSSQASTPTQADETAAARQPPPVSSGWSSSNLTPAEQPRAQRAKAALNRIKQRRLSTAREGGGGGPAANSAAATDLYAIQHQQQSVALRSRSQSPTQMAFALLAAGGTPQSSSSAAKGLSPSVCSAPSSSPSSVQLRQQHNNRNRLPSTSSSSCSSAKLLKEARQRLKKSQENLAVLQDEELPLAGVGCASLPGDLLPRSRSIGNLHHHQRGAGTAADERVTPVSHWQKRKMARSTTDLLAGRGRGGTAAEEAEMADGQGRLADCRERLAQSIRDMRRISESDLRIPDPQIQMSPEMAFADNSGFCPVLLQSPPTGSALDSSAAYYPLASGGIKGIRRGVQKRLERQAISSRQMNATEGKSATFYDANPLFGADGGQMTARRTNTTDNFVGPPRSVSSLASPRSNYLTQKLALTTKTGNGSPQSSLSPSSRRLQDSSFRSLSGELAAANNALVILMADPGSKRMALHAQECIREMTQACDKLIGTQQLIRHDPAIGSDEKRQLLVHVNRAIAAFRQRLDEAASNHQEDEGRQREQQQQQDGDG